ncbi:hypothetical protein ACQKQD_05015 [Methylobacterium sp. NPDC080182]|uniref:hypothetical protein n=1 Tax=Methylobacterium sp. NPDC080182 TaxID=3390590 RepID=UPI003D011B85
MPSFDVAHVNQSGQNMVIVPLDSSFEYKSSFEQDDIMSELQGRSRAAGMAGSVVAVWERNGQMRFRAPPRLHSHINALGMYGVLNNINKRLYW